MAKILKIYRDEDPILRVKCREIEKIEPWVLVLAGDMWDTMKAYKAVGLAGNQVGYDYRIITIDGPEFSGVMINPIIEEKSEEIVHFVEGCLSIPEAGFDTGKRSRAIGVSYYDISGKKQKLWTKEVTAVIIQHEVDHLDGVLMLDYMDERL